MFSWSLAPSSTRSFFDLFFLSKVARLVDDLDFFGLRPWSIGPSDEVELPESEDLSLIKDLSEILLFVFLCMLGGAESSFRGSRRG